MPRQRINKENPQTIFDVLLQYSGAISSLFDFLNVNDLEELEIPADDYFEPIQLKDDVVRELNPTNSIYPVIGSNEGVDPYNLTVTVNDEPFNILVAGSSQDIILVDALNNPIPAILNENEIIVDLDIDYKFYEHNILKDNFTTTPGSNVNVEINRPYTHTITNDPLGNTPENSNPLGDNTDVHVKVNGSNFNIWRIGTSHNIVVKDTNGNRLNVVLNGNKIVVKSIEIAMKINGILQGMVSIPLTQNEQINIV